MVMETETVNPLTQLTHPANEKNHTERIRERLRNGWMLRKKKIKGVAYAYVQKGTKLESHGRW